LATFPDIDDLTHNHIYLGSAHDERGRRTQWVVALAAGMMIVEIVAGYATGSMALLAEGFHMATHAGALGVAAAAYAFARRHAANPAFCFGTGKVGELTGFASALILGLIALGIGVESVMRLFEPTTVAFGDAAVVATLGLAVNVASAMLLSDNHAHHPHGHDHAAHEHAHVHVHDNNFRSAYVHVVADALTSALAIIALLAGRFLGWAWMDPLVGIVGGVIIARWSWFLLRDTAFVLLDVTNQHVASEVRALVEGPGDARIADLHVWRVGPEGHAGILSVVCPKLDAAAIRARLTPVHELRHLTIELR